MQTQVKRMRERAGMTQKQLAEALGITQQSVYYYESGDRDIKASTLIEMSKILKCSVSELLGIKSARVLAPISDEAAFVEIPLFGAIAAGTPIEMDATDRSFLVPGQIHAMYPDAFLLEVRGNSMNRILPDGCYALVQPCKEVEADNKPYAVCVNGFDATIKRIRKLNNGFELVPDSNDPTYKPRVFDYGQPGTETITVIGRVVWHCVPFDWDY